MLQDNNFNPDRFCELLIKLMHKEYVMENPGSNRWEALIYTKAFIDKYLLFLGENGYVQVPMPEKSWERLVEECENDLTQEVLKESLNF